LAPIPKFVAVRAPLQATASIRGVHKYARSQEQAKISEKEDLADYARRCARRALASDSKIRLTMTLALPQLVQRSRLTNEAIGAVELTPKRASAASSKMPSWRQ
jgi:hypothetical protein